MDAARDALRLLDRIDAHAPEGLSFGGEGRVRKQLREALRRAEGPLAPDPMDHETSEAFEAAEARFEQETIDGRAMGEAERASFELGFLQARSELRLRR